MYERDTTSMPPPVSTQNRSLAPQRKCGCGKTSGMAGQCGECETKKLSVLPSPREAEANRLRSPQHRAHAEVSRAAHEPQHGHNFANLQVNANARTTDGAGTSGSMEFIEMLRRRVRDRFAEQATPGVSGLSGVHRVESQGEPGTTNYAFDTFQVTESQLSDPDIIARFDALSKTQLREYSQKSSDPAVISYIEGLIATRASTPCTAAEVTKTNKMAEDARKTGQPLVAAAHRALSTTLTPTAICALRSNFNTAETAPEFQTRRLVVARRLQSLSTHMQKAVAFNCSSVDDPICTGKGNADTIAYVVNNQAPINFCQEFRDSVDPVGDQAVVIHEYSHLMSGIDDAGGYAGGGAGPQTTTCDLNIKFKAAGDVLVHTADALTGFVMHMAQAQSANTPAAPGGTPNPPAGQDTTPP